MRAAPISPHRTGHRPSLARIGEVNVKTAGELRAEAQRLRDLERGTIHPEVLAKLRELIAVLEARAREMENGA